METVTNRNRYTLYPGRGFSLIEGLMAIFLILMLLLFVVSLFPTTRAGLQLSENHVNASFLGRNLIDEARRSDFASLVSSSGSVTITGTDNNNAFSQLINYTVTAQAVDTDQKYVKVVLTWHEKTGDKTVVLDTYVVNPKG